MRVIADICVTPFTGRASVREEVALAHKTLADTGLPTLLHAFGTNIEGDYDAIMKALKRTHQELHRRGVPRISTTIRVSSRTDKEESIRAKVEAVKEVERRSARGAKKKRA